MSEEGAGKQSLLEGVAWECSSAWSGARCPWTRLPVRPNARILDFQGTNSRACDVHACELDPPDSVCTHLAPRSMTAFGSLPDVKD
jgi:hypothetical protein